jgi:hypothetical protein
MEKPNKLTLSNGGFKMAENEDDNDDTNYRYRVVTLLSVEERVVLEDLAWRSGRSMSGYLRHLVNEAIKTDSD